MAPAVGGIPDRRATDQRCAVADLTQVVLRDPGILGGADLTLAGGDDDVGASAGKGARQRRRRWWLMSSTVAPTPVRFLFSCWGGGPGQAYAGSVTGPRRNRVTPWGEIVATELRGAWLGNRGILHQDNEIVRSHTSTHWITCALTYRDRRVLQWEPHHYTALFFHDEAVALAAGHRPCARCRRADYDAYSRALASAGTAAPGTAAPGAGQLDHQLHAERLVRGTRRRRTSRAGWGDLPSGAFVVADDATLLVLDDAVVPWTRSGYGARRRRPAAGSVDLLTPASSVLALRGGYHLQLDPGVADG